jgi:hypothetical protein
MRVPLARAVFATALLVPWAAWAADATDLRTASLNWVRRSGTEVCPGPAVVARAIERRLGHPVFVPPSRADLAVEAYVEHAETGWHVAISLSGAEETVGQRDLFDQEASCDHVTESAVLAIALMIDPDAVLGPEPPASVAPVPTPEAVADRPSAPPPAPSVRWHGSVEIASGIATGLLPELAPGLFARGRAALPSRQWALELEAAYYFEQSVALESAPAKQARFAIFYGGVSFCWLPELAPGIGALACAGADVGTIAASGRGFSIPQPQRQTLLFNVVAKGRLSFRVTDRWMLLAGGDAFVPLWRDRFQAKPSGTDTDIFRLPALAGAFELGISLEF